MSIKVSFWAKGGMLGRHRGSNKSIKAFLAKPKSKDIISLLNKGKTLRDIAGRLGVSQNLVVKVRKHMPYDNRQADAV
jgi:DNA-binding CsgD family transcriptional regulator